MSETPTSIIQRLLFSAALDLSAKAFAQPVGVEDNWEDLGDGIVEISPQNTLRVIRAPAPKITNTNEDDINEPAATQQDELLTNASSSSTSTSGKKKKKSKKNKHNTNTTTNILDMENNSLPDILIEDHISEEIPLVGKDCCIVWNSPTHDMSFCIMFTSECGYSAVWSAVHLLQGKSEIPSLGWDYLSCFKNLENFVLGKTTNASSSSEKQQRKMKKKNEKKSNNNSSPPKFDDDMMLSSSVRPSQTEEEEQEGENDDDNDSAEQDATLKENISDVFTLIQHLNDDDEDMLNRSRSPSSSDGGGEEAGGDGDGNKNSKSSISDSLKKNNKNNNNKQPNSLTVDNISDALTEALRHVSSMSFIHRHCLAQSYIDGRYAVTNPNWAMKDAYTAQLLFSLFHPGLIFHTVDDDEVFEKLLSVVCAESDPSLSVFGTESESESSSPKTSKTQQQQELANNKTNKTKMLKRWSLPKVLPESDHGVDVPRALNRAMRLSLLRHEMVVPGTEEGVLTFLETLQQQELHSVLAAVTDNVDFINELVNVIGNAQSSPAKVEASVRCIADVVQNAVTLLPREMMMPMVARIDDAGLVDSLEKLCSRILDLVAQQISSSSNSKDNNNNSINSSSSLSSSSPNQPQQQSSSSSTSSVLTPDIAKMMSAIAYLFEASAVCLNVRAEEGILGGFWRKPLMSFKPGLSSVLKLLALWGRIMPSGTSAWPNHNRFLNNTSLNNSSFKGNRVGGGRKSSTSSVTSNSSSVTGGGFPLPKDSSNQKTSQQLQQELHYTSGLHRGGAFFLYHLCGLHDDEGHTVDRNSDAPVVALRDSFQLHIATHVIPLMVQAANSTTNLNASTSGSSSSSSTISGGGSTKNAAAIPSSPMFAPQITQHRAPMLMSSELAFFESLLQWCNLSTLKKLLQSLLLAPSSLPSLLAAFPSTSTSSNSNEENKKNEEQQEAEENDNMKNTTTTKSSNILRQQLPSHVACARVRMIRNIFQAMIRLDILINEENLNNGLASAGDSTTSLPLMASNKSSTSDSTNTKNFNINNIIGPLLMRLSFDHDVMNPILAVFDSSRKSASRRGGSMLIGAMNQLLGTIQAGGQILFKLRKFLRIRHRKELPEDFVEFVEQEEELVLRDEMFPATQQPQYSDMGMMTSHYSTYGTGAGTLSLNSNKGGTRSPGSSSLLVSTGGGGGGMFLSNSGNGGTSPGGTEASPSRRMQLVVDAEVPPPRSPEQIPLRKRSPSPETTITTTTGNATNLHHPSTSSTTTTTTTSHQQQHQPQVQSQSPRISSGRNADTTATPSTTSTTTANSVIAADLSSSGNIGSTTANVGGGGGFRPVAPPTKPKGEREGGQSPRANSTGTSTARPGSRGGGGGMSSSSSGPVTGSSGSSSSSSSSSRPKSGGNSRTSSAGRV